MKPTLKEMITALANEHGLKVPSVCIRASDDTQTMLNRLMSWINSNPDAVSDIIEEVMASSAYGDAFFEYFSDDDMFEELVELHEYAPDRFYDIVKSYELFLNICAKTAGYTALTIRLNINDLLGE